VIYLFSDIMIEWNNDEISKLIDFIEKRSFMYDPSDVAAPSTMLSTIFLVQETVMNLCQIFEKFLVTVSVTSFWCLFRRLNVTITWYIFTVCR